MHLYVYEIWNMLTTKWQDGFDQLLIVAMALCDHETKCERCNLDLVVTWRCYKGGIVWQL